MGLNGILVQLNQLKDGVIYVKCEKKFISDNAFSLLIIFGQRRSER